jgi:hypothetical protein
LYARNPIIVSENINALTILTRLGITCVLLPIISILLCRRNSEVVKEATTAQVLAAAGIKWKQVGTLAGCLRSAAVNFQYSGKIR